MIDSFLEYWAHQYSKRDIHTCNGSIVPSFQHIPQCSNKCYKNCSPHLFRDPLYSLKENLSITNNIWTCWEFFFRSNSLIDGCVLLNKSKILASNQVFVCSANLKLEFHVNLYIQPIRKLKFYINM